MNFERNNNSDVWQACFAALDLTSLNTTDSERSIAEFAGRAARFAVDFPHLPPPAGVCVYPSFVDTVGLALGGSRMRITSVAGGFPSSQTFMEVKLLEAKMAVENGADEIDVVISVGEVLDGQCDMAAAEIALLREEVGEGTVLKVIIESGALGSAEKIRVASMLAMEAGADFIKTSTGKLAASEAAAADGAGVEAGATGATPRAAEAMCLAIREFYEKTGRRVGFKVAGGVRTVDDAVRYYSIVEEILGPEWLTPALFRIGASTLANALLSAIEGKDIKYF